jgi:hypothetical protein
MVYDLFTIVQESYKLRCMRTRLRRTLREMVGIGLGLAVFLYLAADRPTLAMAGAALAAGMIVSPLGWLFYRLVRFIFIGSRSSDRFRE